jgi:hypothetical protein
MYLFEEFKIEERSKDLSTIVVVVGYEIEGVGYNCV